MKAFLLLLAMFGLYTGARSQCSNYYFLTKNNKVEMTIYNQKGEQSGRQTWTINSVKKDGASVSSSVNSVLVDEKGKEVSKGQGSFACTGNTFRADIRVNLPQQAAGLGETDASVNSGYVDYPASMQAGQALTNTNLDMDVKNKSGMTMKVEFRQTDRKVEAKETVVTPAGTWTAFRIRYKATITTRTAGIGIPFHFSAVEWFVPGFGIIKTETHSKKGKLLGSTVVTAISK